MAQKNTDKIYCGIAIDWETSGLSCKKNAVTQLGAQIIRLDTFEVIDSYEALITPYPKQTFDKKKVVRKKKDIEEEKKEAELLDYDWGMMNNITGITEVMLNKEGIPLEQMMEEFIEFCKKANPSGGKATLPVIIAQNAVFDIGFLEQACAYTKKSLKGIVAGGDGFHNFIIRHFDTLDLAHIMFANDKSVTSYKLELLAERLDIDLFGAHSAKADAEACNDIVRVLGNRMRSGDGSVGAQVKKVKTRSHWNM